MKRIVGLASSIILLSAAAAVPQPPAAAGQPPAAATGQKVGIATSLQRGYAAIKLNLTQAAEKMPEADYSFQPPGTKDIRPFGALFGHVANAQFNQCAAAKGVPNPNQGNDIEKTKTAKADLVKALADSFAFCDDAFSSVTDETAMQFVKQGPNEVTRAAVLYSVIVHGNEMYGTANPYMRLKGMIPPSTERAQGRGRGGN
jgi:hypothetical protein